MWNCIRSDVTALSSEQDLQSRTLKNQQNIHFSTQKIIQALKSLTLKSLSKSKNLIMDFLKNQRDWKGHFYMSGIPLKKWIFMVFLFYHGASERRRRLENKSRIEKDKSELLCACLSVSSIFHELCSCSLSLHSFVIPPSLSSIKLQVFFRAVVLVLESLLFECQIYNSIVFSTKV